jgi:putative phage-type endonuclease
MSFNILASTENMPYDEWLGLRKNGIGGSDASVVCGINKWKSPIELWMEKTDQMPCQEAGEAAYWGNQLESLVKSEFTKRTGIEITPLNQLLQSIEYPYMLANIDGTCSHPIYGPCIFEAKTSSAYRAEEWSDNIPDEYILQVQHYLTVTGYPGAYIAVLIGGNTFNWKFIERDDELIAMLIQLEGDFWRHIQERVPPAMDGSDASAKFLSERFPDSIPASKIVLPADAAALINQYETACEEVKKFTEQKQEAENLLKQMIGDSESGVIGNRVVTWKSITQERLDSTTLKTEHPALYRKFSNKISYRRFDVKAAASEQGAGSA